MELALDSMDEPVILVVDDNPDELFATSRILEKQGFKVEAAKDGHEALELAMRINPDLILLDVVMPSLDGYEVCRQLKDHALLCQSSVMLMSSVKNTPEHQAKGLDSGADGFIARPYDSREFISRVRSMLRIKQVEKELRRQQEWFRVTLSSIGDGLIATDTNGQILFINDVAENLSGWTGDEAQGNSITEVFNVINEKTGARITSPIAQALQREEILNLEDNLALINKNGEVIQIADSVAPIRTEEGEILGGVLVFRDIRHQIEAMKQIASSQRSWDALFNTTNQSVLVLSPDFKIIDTNEVVVKKSGVPKRRIVGKYCFDFINCHSGPHSRCPMQKVIDTGRKASVTQSIQQYNGHHIVTCTPVINEAGAVEKIVHIATDISDLKEIKRQRSESEAKYRSVFKCASDAIVLVDARTNAILDANEEALSLYGYSISEMRSLKVDDLELPEEPIEGQQTLHRKKDGSSFPVELTTSSVWLNQRITRIVAIRDISTRLKTEDERKKLEGQLFQSEKLRAIGTLAGGIAHDFNNLLTTIIGNAEMAIEELQGAPVVEECLRDILAASNLAGELTSQILTIARRDEKNNSPFSMAEVIRDIVRFIGATTPSSIEIETTVVEDCTIFADRSRIHQVLLNLCTNATQAMPNNSGLIKITMVQEKIEKQELNLNKDHKKDVCCKIVVSDNGCGMSPEVAENIFEPYFTTKEPGKGTGLGLAMVQSIVANYGGNITFISSPGAGTSFTIHLPLYKGASVKQALPPDEVKVAGLNVIFVDDEPLITKMTQRQLNRDGFEVKAFNNPLKAFEAIERKPEFYDVVVTDVNMPHLRGDELARKIRKISKELPIIMISGNSSKLSQELIENIGNCVFLPKPIKRNDLQKAIRNITKGENQ